MLPTNWSIEVTKADGDIYQPASTLGIYALRHLLYHFASLPLASSAN
ncbi:MULTISPECIES: hypothetical protein [unclassified Nostoc]|nr:hypothetical protein [Nostoc sp. DedVER02]MDZ7984780.1 hypothetical protein [Nostoc sp. DedVER02]MDZ8115331.1 hypothetical protein [Nostoc sp. DedVER01b]